MTVPLAVATAVFLNENRSRLRRLVRIYVDAMSGLPSIVAGLFIFAVLIIPYAEKTDLFGYNGFMASLALSLIMIPTFARTVEVVLRLDRAVCVKRASPWAHRVRARFGRSCSPLPAAA